MVPGYVIPIDSKVVSMGNPIKRVPFLPKKNVFPDAALLHHKVLSKGGLFIYLTFGQPHFRQYFLIRSGITTLEIKELGDSFHYYLYIMRTHPSP
jgi:hypothetical protein